MNPALKVRADAPVMEVFASIQGEGLYVGEPQVFLRLAGCPLRCAWCDTPGSWQVQPDARARVVGADGPRREEGIATPFQALCWAAAVEPAAPRTISITGGEPLMWPEFILGLASVAGDRRLHLETAGGHPDALERVLPAIHHVSLDLKLPADLAEPVPELGDLGPDAPAASAEASPRDSATWREARRSCLRLIRDRDACCKIVVSGNRTAVDYRELLDDHAELAPRVPLFIQPVTPLGSVVAAPPELVSEIAEEARELELVVRVVPQVHRLLGIA